MYTYFIKQPIIGLVLTLALIVAYVALIVVAFIHYGFIASLVVLVLGDVAFRFLSKKFKAAKLQLQQKGKY